MLPWYLGLCELCPGAVLSWLKRTEFRCCLVLVEADEVEVAPATELLQVHPLSVLGVAALVLLVSRPLPKATALGGSMLGVRAMVGTPPRSGRVDTDDLC